ncbi:Hsp70 family protein [Granulosicoccus antarcticus]|uniref:Chaperone protein HscC n=1 Tax=Granulosicoccus antarcticus IMCC3135 TaxID=1192854 RepID=A0A2Z2NRT5_9GAMM|nr:Hsp70 family protein [Granulosicoccus antarcticus]ASJ73959.1 Chaperone protein HscC [Granulosicoccus antarcticus IMCC3135]
MANIGIDLGTTHSLICVFENGAPRLIENVFGSPLTPSVVALDTENKLVVGDPAKAMLVSDPKRAVAVFKRHLGTQAQFELGPNYKFGAVDLCALVLRDLCTSAEQVLGESIDSAVISVPAYFNQNQRKDVVTAAQLIGLTVTRLINEPTAAALAYGLQEREGESTFMVFDMGGGTFDVSILEMFEGVMEVRATAGNAFLGGEDFTRCLAQWIAAQNDLGFEDLDRSMASRFIEVAENTKRALTQQLSVSFARDIQGMPVEFDISRQVFEDINKTNIKRLRAPVERALYDARINREDLDRVILVGGASRMSLIRSFVAKHLLKLPESTLNADHVVAQGAAIQAALVANDAALEDLVMTDVSAFTLGMEITKQIDRKRRASGFFQPIIERNSVVPISRLEAVQTAEPGQERITVQVFQGESPMVEDNVSLGKLKVKVPYNRDECEQVEVRFSYDASGLLEVEAMTSDGKTSSLVITTLSGEMSSQDLAKRIAVLDKLKVHPRDQLQNIDIMARLKKCYAMSLGDDRDMIMSWITGFDAVMGRQNPREIEALRTEMAGRIDEYEDYYVK